MKAVISPAPVAEGQIVDDVEEDDVLGERGKKQIEHGENQPLTGAVAAPFRKLATTL